MSDIRRIRIAGTNGKVQRLTIAAELSADIEVKTETTTTYYSGRQENQLVTVFALLIKRGDTLLARLPGVASFRDESITVEDADASNGHIEWIPAE